MGGGVKKWVLEWGRGPRGEGATLYPYIYNIFFYMTYTYKSTYGNWYVS